MTPTQERMFHDLRSTAATFRKLNGLPDDAPVKLAVGAAIECHVDPEFVRACESVGISVTTPTEEAQILRRAAEIVRGRSKKPNGLVARVLVSILNDAAAAIERGTWEQP